MAAVFAALGTLVYLVVPDARITWDAARVAPLDEVVPLGLACLGQVLRHVRPLAGLALGVAGLLSAPVVGDSLGIITVIACADLLYMAVLDGSPRVSRSLTAGSWALVGGLAVMTLVLDGPREAIRTVMSTGSLLIPVLWAREVRQHRELARHERARAEDARRVAELDRAAALTAERARMARDLHDVVAGQLSGIAVQSAAALSLADPPRDVLRRVLGDVRRDSVAALTEMRAMIGLLRDGTADPPAAPAGLSSLDALLAAARSRGLDVAVVDARTSDAGLPAAVDLAAYRIVAEALTNAAKHAPRSSVRLTLRDGTALVVEVENDLPGARGAAPVDEVTGTGTGLLGLGERATAVGGRLEAGPVGAVWSLRAELPIGGAR